MVVRSVCVDVVAQISFWITQPVFGVAFFRPFMEEEEEERLNLGLGEDEMKERDQWGEMVVVVVLGLEDEEGEDELMGKRSLRVCVRILGAFWSVHIKF